MMVQSPLKRREVQPNLRKLPKPEASSSSQKTSAKKNRRVPLETGGHKIGSIKPGTVILVSLIIGVLGFLYLTHVFATQRLLDEVQLLEKEYNRARQQHDELKLEYDRLIGPAEIYRKAEAQGFVNGGPADHVIEVEK